MDRRARNRALPVVVSPSCARRVVRVLLLGAAGLAAPGLAQEMRRETLGNGATLLVLRVPGLAQVGVEACYEVGFLHEPARLPQAAHLLEHLACNAATRGHGSGEAMALLNRLGLANAETMPDWMHFDYAVPADQLGTVLHIEAERLQGLRIDAAIVRQEAARCCREVETVAQNPAAGLLKFAFTALNQHWRHGATEARLRTGLDACPVAALEQLRAQCLRPDRLALVIVGDVDEDAALALARQTLGPLENPGGAPPAAIDWSRVPRRATVRWDCPLRAVCLAFPPPADATARRLLGLWGAVLQQELARDPQLAAGTDLVFASNPTWMVGTLPFFVYAAVKDGTPVETVEQLLAARLAQAVARAGPSSGLLAGQARLLAAVPRQLTAPALRQAAGMLAERQGVGREQAVRMALAQGALQWGMAVRFLGPDPAAAAAAFAALPRERVAAILAENLKEDRRLVAWLLPADAPKAEAERKDGPR